LSSTREDVERLKTRLGELDTEIAEISSKIDSADADDRAEYLDMRADLLRLRDAASRKLREMEDSKDEEDAFEKIASDLDDAWESLEDAVRNATTRLIG